MKSIGISLVWILLSGSLLTPIGFLPAFATAGSSTITISSSQDPSISGQSVTFTATVSPSTATGIVQFNDTGTSPPTMLGTGTLSGGAATFSTSSLSVGNHNIIAKYLGDTNNLSSISTTLTQAVNPAPLIANGINIATTEGTLFQGILAHFTDADPNAVASDYAASINWGDGTTTNAVIAANSNGGFDVQGTHTYAEEGSHPISIIIVDGDATTTNATSEATVTDAPLTASAININTVVNTSFQGILAHFTDADPNAVASDYAASINWGDGTTTNAVIAANSNGGFDVQGTHTYAASGAKPISISINDTGGSSVIVTGTTTVNPLLTATATSLSSNATSIIFGHSIAFTARVSPSTITGTIQLLVNGTSLGFPVALSSGQAMFSTSSLPAGTDNVVASYSGDSNFDPSTSNSIIITVTTSGSGGGQSGNGTLSSASNLGQLVSDFVHQRNALLKEQRKEALSIIHTCQAEIKNASQGNTTQIHSECKLQLKESNQKFKELQKQLNQEFEHLKAQFASAIKKIQKEQKIEEKNETQNFKKQILHLVGKVNNHGKGLGKQLRNNILQGKNGHQETGDDDN